MSGTISAPPATYTVYGYDIEENVLPNSTPAVILNIVNTTSTSE